jgi:predicted ABC-type sugar transport system permease subunit
MSVLRLLSRTKLYWGLLVILLIGIAFSPVSGSGRNIFLSYGNLTDVLRQVSITGLVAVGMTVVILIAGIDLSVGSVMAFGTVLTATLLTEAGWTSAATVAVPAAIAVAFLAPGARRDATRCATAGCPAPPAWPWRCWWPCGWCRRSAPNSASRPCWWRCPAPG